MSETGPLHPSKTLLQQSAAGTLAHEHKQAAQGGKPDNARKVEPTEKSDTSAEREGTKQKPRANPPHKGQTLDVDG